MAGDEANYVVTVEQRINQLLAMIVRKKIQNQCQKIILGYLKH